MSQIMHWNDLKNNVLKLTFNIFWFALCDDASGQNYNSMKFIRPDTECEPALVLSHVSIGWLLTKGIMKINNIQLLPLCEDNMTMCSSEADNIARGRSLRAILPVRGEQVVMLSSHKGNNCFIMPINIFSLQCEK